MSPTQHSISVAPMMDWTDRHCRFFHRLLAPSACLYTEMVTTGAVLHGDRERLLGFNPCESPVALQLGGSEPDDLAQAARIGADYGYDELNLNVGCPSDRVQKGRFGACLMLEPERVRDGLAAMCNVVDIPVTVKTRIGVDEHDSEAFLHQFVETVTESGIETVIVHARKAWLSGLSPKQNREVPPLDYERVHRLKQQFDSLRVVLNGGITDRSAALELLQRFDGIMIGRAAYQNPWLLAELHNELEPGSAPVNRAEVVEKMAVYVRGHLERGGKLQHVARHMLGLFHSQPGGRGWRQQLSQHMHRPDANAQLLLDSIPRPALSPVTKPLAGLRSGA
ncbi:MAG: tRNA dihydrouridine(20/20a) synthase DusA [Pseudomonadota bacterium]